jgi:hypothetical protein
MSKNSYSVGFYRLRSSIGGSIGWMRFSKSEVVSLQVSVDSLMIRCSSSLIADIPKGAIKSFHMVMEGLVRVVLTDVNQGNFAIDVQPRSELIALVKELKKFGFPGVKNSCKSALSSIGRSEQLYFSSSTSSIWGMGLPDLKDPIVEQMVLQLLFDEQFQEYVDEIGHMLQKFIFISDAYKNNNDNAAATDYEDEDEDDDVGVDVGAGCTSSRNNSKIVIAPTANKNKRQAVNYSSSSNSSNSRNSSSSNRKYLNMDQEEEEEEEDMQDDESKSNNEYNNNNNNKNEQGSMEEDEDEQYDSESLFNE